MTSANIVDTTQPNGHSNDKSPEEIQLEIARTRTAITEDLLAISERLSPQHLRESAREMMKDAREEAKGLMKDAKDAAFDSLVGVKDRAVESVSEKVQQLGTQARRASDLTVNFVSANAVAVSLVGFGVGILLVALQRRRSPPLRLQQGYSHEHYRLVGSAPSPRPALSEQVRSAATHATRAVDHARDEVRSASARAGRSAREGMHHAGEGARRVAGRTRATAGGNGAAVLAITVAAGLGFGLLWPLGDRRRPVSRGY